MKRTVTAIVTAALVCGLSAQGGGYAAPDGAFAFRPPAGWTVTRGPVGDNGFSTSFSAGAAEAFFNLAGHYNRRGNPEPAIARAMPTRPSRATRPPTSDTRCSGLTSAWWPG